MKQNQNPKLIESQHKAMKLKVQQQTNAQNDEHHKQIT